MEQPFGFGSLVIIWNLRADTFGIGLTNTGNLVHTYTDVGVYGARLGRAEAYPGAA